MELQQSDQEDHDQLPNVEEYKAVIGHRSGAPGGFKSKVFKAIGNLGPSSASGIEEEGEFVVPPMEQGGNRIRRNTSTRNMKLLTTKKRKRSKTRVSSETI